MPAGSVHGSVRLELGPPVHAPRDEVRGGRGGRTLGHRNTTRKVGQAARNGFAGEGIRRGARIHVCIRVEAVLVLEYRAVLDDARGSRALVHGAREHAAVPPVHEVAVQSVAGRVAVREDEAPAVVQGVEWRNVEPDLVEDRDEVDRM